MIRELKSQPLSLYCDKNNKSLTFHKVITEYETALSCPDPEASLESVLTTQSRYNSSRRGPRVITGSLKDLIDDCLEKNALKRAMALKKQCMRGKDIYELLIDKGFQVSYTGVCKYIASVATVKKEDKSQEAFIRGYYHFCNARAGWEKGHVEHSV